MSRWIDADAVKEALKQNTPQYMWGEILTTVNVQPYIDLVVRCKECKYLAVETEDEGTSWYYCTPNGHEVDETDFCSWGEARGE